jgi:hypothetical protein
MFFGLSVVGVIDEEVGFEFWGLIGIIDIAEGNC